MNTSRTRESGHDSEDEKITNTTEEHELQERRERIHQITQPTRFDLIQDILMHPQQMPSMKELDFLQPDRSRSTIREHLDRLIDMGIVTEESLEQDRVQRDKPRKFFRLSKEGKEELERLDLLGIEDTLQYLYSNTEKPEEIVEYEEAPRPKIKEAV